VSIAAAPAARSRLTIALAALSFALLASFAPAAAQAFTYTVNNTGDAPDIAVGSGGCDSDAAAGLQCTLRAAIEESNNSAEEDNIFFDGSTFLGDPNGNHVTINSNLPAITDSVRISGTANGSVGGRCEVPTKLAGEPTILGPCVQLERTGSGPGLEVEADEVQIDGLDIVGMTFAIDVLNESTGFVAGGDWIGLKLNGEPGGNTTGIFLDPNSNEAVIGGPNEAENVIAGNGTGLQLQGASEASIEGNYFGVAQDGASLANNTAGDLKITDSTASPGFPAAKNQIGADVGSAATATPACDGGCNVFGSRDPGANNIDLNGSSLEQAPASGPTFFGGNYVGLNAAGDAIESIGFAGTGIFVGGADEVQIGGPEPGEANRFTGGDSALVAGPRANDLFIADNAIGLNAEETETVEPPNFAGLSVDSNGVTAQHAARIVGNRIFPGAAAKGIEQIATGATIADNRVSGGKTGIYARRGESGGGNEIADNAISSTLGDGVLIENDENLVVGNKITHAGAAGVRVQNFGSLASTGNTIGGDEVGDENEISESQGNAIEVADEEDDETLIARNNGAGNAGLFIDLGADGPGNALEGPNGGIQAPAITSATSTAASGSALPGADVRVFLKATGEPGEIAGFLGKATADGSGKWMLAYGLPLTPGTEIAATQTGLLGTSELAIATTAAPPKEEGGGQTGGGGTTTGGNNGKGKGKGKGKGVSGDTTPPQTKIVKGPKARTHSRTAKFKFTSSEAGSTFQCRLDRGKFKKCRSLKKLTGLKPGKHVFKVRAKDPAGNVDATPAKRVWRVLG
jgi:hypothetical protein